MRSGKHLKKNFLNLKKSTIAAIVLALVAVAVVGTTIAYLKLSSGAVQNDFVLSKIECEIEEEVSDSVKSSVKIKNTGDTEAYIRAAVIANSVDEDGNINGAANVDAALCGTNWVKSGNYYYYKIAVAPGANTENLLKDSINLSGIQVTILAEAIQSEPADAVQSAWGVSPASLGSN